MVEPAYEQKLIGELLAKQPGIEDSVIMTYTPTIPYYANSKFLHAVFIEGNENDSIAVSYTHLTLPTNREE